MSIRPHACHQHRIMIGILFAVLLLTLGAVVVSYATTQARPSSQTATPAPAPVIAWTEPYIEYAPNTALVKLKAGVALSSNPVRANGASVTSDAQSLNSLLQAFGAATAEPVFGETGSTTARAGRPSRTGLERIYRVQWTAQVPVDHAVAALAADPAVEYAEPDYIARAARTPNDPEYASQWALPKINAPAAWDITTGSSDVIIAIIDSGVDTAHPDFAGRLWVNDDPINGIDDDLNGKVDDLNGWNIFANSNDLIDPNGHGSEVGGVVGAATDNGAGVAGMCWTCRLMFVNAMQPSFVANYSDVAAAVQYAASNGAQVINLSLGGYADSAMLRDAISEAAITAVIVGGAGNDDSSNPFYPAAYPEVLAVAATDNADQKAVFSNYGPWVDVSAPGKEIHTTTVGGYATSNGTSLATPFVGGLAGLLKSQHPTWTPEQVKWQILNTAVNIDALNPTRAGQLGSGRIDAGAALGTAPQARAAVEGYAIDGQANARPAPGQAFQLALNLRNLWLLGQNLQGTLTSGDPHVTVTDAAGAFGDISAGQVGSNSSDPFGVTVANDTPYNHSLTFTLNLSGAGGYSLAVPFTVQVRSAVETLSNTRYTHDVTWTSDKTYNLNGVVIVGQGVTLTIQPGTTITISPTKYIRVDGTLIAQGTLSQPIRIASGHLESACDVGAIMLASSAVFDENGNYSGGSILRYLDTQDLAISAGQTYIADSKFRNTSIGVGGTSAPRIERNTFLEIKKDFCGTNVIQSDDAVPVILHNTFLGPGPSAVVGRQPYIKGNYFAFWDKAIDIQGRQNLGTTAVIRDNTILGNNVGVFLDEVTRVDIQHNLIVANTTGGVSLGTGSLTRIIDPQIEYSPTSDAYILTWGEGHHGPSDWGGGETITAFRLSGEGQPIESAIPLIARNGLNNIRLVFNPDKNEFLIASSLTGELQRLSANGLPLGGFVLPNNTYARRHNLTPIYQTAATGYLLGWETADGKVFVQRAKSTGEPIGSVIQTDHEDMLLEFKSIAYDPTTDRALIIAEPRGGGTMWIGFAPPVTSTVIMLTDLGVRIGEPKVIHATNVNRYLVIGDSFAGQFLHSDGSLDGNLFPAFNGDRSGIINAVSPALVYAGNINRFMAVWAATTESNLTQIWGQQINEDGSLQGAPILVSDSRNQVQIFVDVVYNSRRGEYLVTWREGPSADIYAYGDIYMQRIGADGQLLDNSWTLADETDPSVNYRFDLNSKILNNTLIDNGEYGIRLGSEGAPEIDINHNNLSGNGEYGLYLDDGTGNIVVDAVGNFWNVSTDLIAGIIRDCSSDFINGCDTASSRVGRVAYDPPLAAPDQTAPAYVRSVSVDPNPVSIEHGTATIDFSAPMMTGTLPTVSFHTVSHEIMEQVSPNKIRFTAKDSITATYSFNDARWISGTRLQASYGFDANIPPGYYTVQVDGAVGSDGITAYGGVSNTFRVDFGAGVTLDPPLPPQVAAQTTGSLGNLSAAWQTSSPNIDQYRYAIGTTPGARNVIGWTYLAGASFIRNDLNLVQGQSYYVTVQARNTSGLWSVNGVSNGVVGGESRVYLPTISRF